MPFQWTEGHQRASQRLKDLFVSAPCLSYPQPGKTFILDTDASEVSISDGNRFQFPKSIIGNKSNSILELESVSWCADCGI